MITTVKLGEQEYDVSVLSEEGQHLLAYFQMATNRLQEAENLHAVLTKARNAYIADLRNEMIQGKTGIDLSTLFSD